jgi:hypothetical protein
VATIDELIGVLRSVEGAPYLWFEGYDGQWVGPPEYMDGSGWSAGDVMGAGINCSGLFNWGLQQVGLSPVGGTLDYWQITEEPIDPDWQKIYSPGQFVVTVSEGQGHMAMVSGPNNLLIQADTYYNNVNENHDLWTQQPYVGFTWVGWIPLDW